MIERAWSAPGKALLFGEYAVVAGGPAVVTAVSRRVQVKRYTQARDGYAVTGPISSDSTLVESVLAEIDGDDSDGRPGEWERSVACFESDVRPLYRDGQKLGLGSSAASAVALTAAVLNLRELETSRQRVFQDAARAHRRWQGGRGSGSGLAAATWGGWQGYRLSDPDSNLSGLLSDAGQTTDAARASSPDSGDAIEREEFTAVDGLRWDIVSLPSRATTRSFLEAVERAAVEAEDVVTEVFAALADIGRRGQSSFRQNDRTRILELVRRADDAMERLGELAGVPIVTEEHRELRRAADKFGLVVKPSGAGGGDISLVAGPDDADWEAFRRDLSSNVALLDVKLGAPGVRREMD